MLHQMFNPNLINWSRIVGGLENAVQICINSSQTGILQNVGKLGFLVPTRNTFVLKRRKEPRLAKKGVIPSKLNRNAYIYDLVDHRGLRKPEFMDVVLKSYIKGLGQQGDVVNVKKGFGYEKLLVPGLADYPTPENIQRWKTAGTEKVEVKSFSSIHVERTINFLNRRVFLMVMNEDNPWTLEPWHVRASLRKAGVHVLREDCIELPSQKIEGPNLDIEGKEFEVTLTINKTEKIKIRCRIHHRSSDLINNFGEYWLQPAEKLFPEDTDKTSSA